MSISVEVKGNLERAIRVLKKKMQSEGIQKDLKRRRFYEKPSVKKNRKRHAVESYGHDSWFKLNRRVFEGQIRFKLNWLPLL